MLRQSQNLLFAEERLDQQEKEQNSQSPTQSPQSKPTNKVSPIVQSASIPPNCNNHPQQQLAISLDKEHNPPPQLSQIAQINQNFKRKSTSTFSPKKFYNSFQIRKSAKLQKSPPQPTFSDHHRIEKRHHNLDLQQIVRIPRTNPHNTRSKVHIRESIQELCYEPALPQQNACISPSQILTPSLHEPTFAQGSTHSVTKSTHTSGQNTLQVQVNSGTQVQQVLNPKDNGTGNHQSQGIISDHPPQQVQLALILDTEYQTIAPIVTEQITQVHPIIDINFLEQEYHQQLPQPAPQIVANIDPIIQENQPRIQHILQPPQNLDHPRINPQNILPHPDIEIEPIIQQEAQNQQEIIMAENVQHVILPPLSTFQPKTFTQHQENYTAKHFFNAYKIWVNFHNHHFVNEDLKVRGLQYVLEGPAGDWIQKLLEQAADHPVDHPLPINLDAMQVLFLQQFHYKKSRSALKSDMQQIRYTPGCIIKNLCKQFEKFVGELKLSTEEAVETFLGILPIQIKAFVAGRRPESMQDICDGVNDYQNYMEIADVTASYKAVSFQDMCQHCKTMHDPNYFCQSIKDKISAEVLHNSILNATQQDEKSTDRSPSRSPERSDRHSPSREHSNRSSHRNYRDETNTRQSRIDSYRNSTTNSRRSREDYSPHRSSTSEQRASSHRASYSPSRDNSSRSYSQNRHNNYRDNRSPSRERYDRHLDDRDRRPRDTSQDRSRQYRDNIAQMDNTRDRSRQYMDQTRSYTPQYSRDDNDNYRRPQRQVIYYEQNDRPVRNIAPMEKVQYVQYRQPTRQWSNQPPQRIYNDNYRPTSDMDQYNSNNQPMDRYVQQRSQSYHGPQTENESSRRYQNQGYVSNQGYQSNL